jgi:dTDP-4-amino-4,6-dideoxygalactose transaminase
MIPYADLKAQYLSIKQEIDEAVSSVLESSQFVLGKFVAAFETDFAAFCGVRHAVGVNSERAPCTSRCWLPEWAPATR